MAYSRHKQIAAIVGIVYVLRKKRLRAKRKQKRQAQFWVRKIFKSKAPGEYHSLYQELRLQDREYHYRYLRMSKERFDHLFSLLETEITKRDTKFRKAIPARARLVVTLRYLATGCSQQTLSYAFRFGRSSACKIISEVCNALYFKLSPLYLTAPSNATGWKAIADDFSKIWNMPHVIGAIDGKHISIDCPKKSGSEDYNHKGFYSIVLLAICDARYNLTAIDAGRFGSNNDSVGDEIFPLKQWLMRPFPGSLSEKQRIFNYRLSRARRTIENTFGILVARWRIFRGPIRASRKNVEAYVLETICLHNYLRQTDNAVYCPTGFFDSENGSGEIKPGEWRKIVEGGSGLQTISRVRGSRYANDAIDIREALKEYVCCKAGSFDWQLEYVRRIGKKKD
eukprot:gene7639-8480_t